MAFALAAAVLGVLSLYAIGMNVFLSTSLFAKVIDGQPDVIDIHYRRGWSWTPGHIHAQNLSIRGRDGNIEWVLRLDEVEFQVSFHALAKQLFDVSHVHGRGISFRVRQRLDAPPPSLDAVAKLPPIEGLAPYAVKPPPQPEPGRWSDADYHLWSAHLEDIVAEDVREVWIDDVRFEGSAKITGRFYFKPVRRADIGPVHVDVHSGTIRSGDSVLLERLGGAAADITETPFDPRTATGMDIVRDFAVAAHLAPAFPDLARLPIAWPAGVRVTGELDARELVLDVRSGALHDGTRFDVNLPHAVATRGEHRFTGGLAATGAVRAADGAPRLDFRSELSGLAVAREGAAPGRDGVILQVPHATAVGDARALGFTALLSDVHVVVDVPAADLPAVSELSAYVPPKTPLAFVGGVGVVSAHLETWRAEQRAAARGSVVADGLDLRLGKMRIRGHAEAAGSFGSFPWETSRLEDAALSLDIKDGSLAADRSPRTALLRVGELRIDAEAPELELDDPLRALHVKIALAAGVIADPNLLRAYLPEGPDMSIASRRGRITLACELAVEDHLARGTLDLASHGLSFAFRDFRSDADLQASARVHDWQWEEGVLALDHASIDVARGAVYRRAQSSRGGPVSVPCAEASAADRRCLALSFARIRFDAKSAHFNFTDPFARVDLSGSLVEAVVRDSSILDAFVPKGAPFLLLANGGGFSGDVQAEIRRHVLRGALALRAQRMGIGGKKAYLVGDIDAQAHVSDWTLAKHTLAVEDSHVAFSHVAGGFHAAKAGDAIAPPPDFHAEKVELWARLPGLDLVSPSMRGLDGHVVIAGAELPDATTLEALMPDESIVAIESGSARVSGDLEMSSTDRSAGGSIDIALPQAGIRFHETHLAGNFDVSVRLAGYEPETNRFDVSGTHFAMREVQVTNASTEASRWQGDVVLKDATLALDPSPELEGEVSVEARDASPVLAMLLGNGLPKVFAGLTSMPHLSGKARLTMGSRRFAIRDLDVRGGDIALDGTYVVQGDQRDGAFVVEKGPFSAGFHLDDQGVHLRLFGLEGWLRDSTRAALRLLDTPGPLVAPAPPPGQ